MSDTTDVTRCALCGRRLASPTVEADDGAVFCSAGCRDVHVTLGGSRTGDDPADEGDDGSVPASTDRGDRADRADRTDAGERTDRADQEDGGSRGDIGDRDPGGGTVRTFLRVDGMYSATCEAFLESVASGLDGASSAEASYVTESVRVDHDRDVITEAELRDALTTLGYTAYLRSEVQREADGSASATRRSRELRGVRKRRDETFLGLRYAVGILFGAFLFVPYVAILYPAHLATLLDGWLFEHYRGAFQLDSAGGFLFLRIYFVMTGVVLFFTGMPVLRGAYVSLKMRRPTTDLLVAATAVSAYAYSTLAVLLGRNDIYYDLTLVVAAAVTAAAFYESAVKKRALNRLTDLTVSQVETARRHEADGTAEVPVEEVAHGDDVLVREGERIPVGGTLREGECIVSDAVVTGESRPAVRRDGDEVVAGSLVTAGAGVVRADERSASGLDRITTEIWNLQSADHGVRRGANRLASRLVPVVATLAVLSGVSAIALGAGVGGSLLAALLALFVLSPWALGLATPLSVATCLEAALDRGVVVFDETVFERLREIDVVVFDKTGTLTTGEMDVVDADAPPTVLDAAVALERRSSHPVARAIVERFDPPDDGTRADGGDGTVGSGDDGRSDGGHRTAGNSTRGGKRRVEGFQNRGTGVEGLVDGERVLVGNPDLFAERGWTVDEELQRRALDAREFGQTPVLLGRDGAAAGIVVVGDEPRTAWDDTLSGIDERGADVVVLTGDHEDATTFLRDHHAVEHVFAGVTPEAKAEAIRRLAAEQQVAMVGDGTNDATALATADLGLSLGGGTALAADAADVAILDDDIGSVEVAFDLAPAARRRVRRNVGLAFLYNASLVPVALAGLMNPVLAMLAVVLTVGAIGVNSTRPLLPS